MKKYVKWSAAVPVRRQDNIVSSRAIAKGVTGFIPDYESEQRPNMTYLMSNEYFRLWFKQLKEYEAETYNKPVKMSKRMAAMAANKYQSVLPKKKTRKQDDKITKRKK